MRLQQNTLFAALVTIFLLSNTTQAIAKTRATAHKQYVLLDPTTGQAQPQTPYFLFFRGDEMQAGPLMTDAKGRTQPINALNKTMMGAHLPLILNLTYQAEPINRDFNDPNNKNILVKAQGQGSQIFIMSLNGLTGGTPMNWSSTTVQSGTPYVIWNRATSQAVCGQANKQGYTDEIKNAAQATVDSAKQTLHNQTLTEDVSQYMHKGMDAAHDMGNQIKSSAVKCANGCGHYISEKPMKSVAIAVGLGALLALVLFNKKH